MVGHQIPAKPLLRERRRLLDEAGEAVLVEEILPRADVVCSILALLAVQRLPDLATTDAVAFGVVLKALHLLLVAPRWLPSFGRSFAEAGGYAVLGVLIAWRRDRVACWPETDCQRSIFVDLVACAVISADAVRRARGPPRPPAAGPDAVVGLLG